MAITQERMISLISSFRRTYDTANMLRREIRAIASSLTPDSSLDAYREALQSLQFLADQPFISESDLSLLVAEEQHFRNSFKKNQRTAAYARRRRAGLPSSLSAINNSTEGDIAERAVSVSLPPNQRSALDGKKSPTSPHNLLLKKPLDQYTTQKPLRSAPAELSTSDMIAKGWLSRLAADKMAMDEKRLAVNMSPLYPDPTDDSIPLTLDDQIALGLIDPADLDEGLF